MGEGEGMEVVGGGEEVWGNVRVDGWEVVVEGVGDVGDGGIVDVRSMNVGDGNRCEGWV